MKHFAVKTSKRFVSGAIMSLLFVFIPVVSESLRDVYLEYLVQVDDIFVYHDVMPAQLVTSQDSAISMVSDTTWYKDGGDVEWLDVLRCEQGGYISEQTTKEFNFQYSKKFGIRSTGTWQYNGALPSIVPNTCHIRSSIRYCHPSSDICENQSIESAPITFIE